MESGIKLSLDYIYNHTSHIYFRLYIARSLATQLRDRFSFFDKEQNYKKLPRKFLRLDIMGTTKNLRTIACDDLD